jgi:energy-coupling factor transporter ATP-binding protein EcfA2
MSEPAPTEFEQRLSKRVDELMALGKTGYVWGPVDELLRQQLGLDGMTRCKKASGSGRAANVLTESNDKDIVLYVVFVLAPYTIGQFRAVAADRISRFPNVRSVAVADRTSGTWRIRRIIERKGADSAQRIRAHFPLIKEADIQIVEDKVAAVDSSGKAVVQIEDEDVFASAAASHKSKMDGFDELMSKFSTSLQNAGIQIDRTMAGDVLTCALSSQFLLFAGPSGTGKSTLARALAEFFAPEDSWRVIEARRQWLGPEDVVGYFSPLTTHFALASDTEKLIDLHESSMRVTLSGAGAASIVPILLVEEVNLSPIEGYLAPLIHGLSKPSSTYVKWPLHGRTAGASDLDESLVVPRAVLLGPYPRLIGTINVDQNSQAPARKVAARATVLLLEPDDRFNSGQAARVLKANVEPKNLPASGVGQPWLGDPAAARISSSDKELSEYMEGLGHLLDMTVVDGNPLVELGRRDIVRCANYMAYYAPLAQSAQEPAPDRKLIVKLAAENAFLHFILPTLPAETFRAVVDRLPTMIDLAAGPKDSAKLGGLLLPRLERLARAASRFAFAEALDFWASLS